jgi:hypothetical protein
MTFLKQLADVLNREHWTGETLNLEMVESLGPPMLVGSIYSICFFNSVCVIRRSVGDAVLGDRVVVGSGETVARFHVGSSDGAKK